MDVYSWSGIAILAVCLALVVFVAAAEAGLISISRARVRLMTSRGVPRANVLQTYIQERDSLLHALAVARNMAIVASAALAASVLTRERGHSWILILSIVLGALALTALLESLSRAVVARSPERWGLRLSPFMGAFKFLFGGVARILYLPLRAVQTKQIEAEEEEMLRMMELEDNEGAIEDDERKMIRGVFGLEETTVREIMTPRIDICAADTDSTPEDAVKLIIERGFSRIPLYEKNADEIVGLIYAKDLFRYLSEGTMPTTLRDVARPAFFVPESKRVDDLLTDMRRQRVHMAIVVDEYGGTAGLVTIEDLLEEIVGEIEDEYDKVEENVIRTSETEAIIDGRVDIDQLNDLFHKEIRAEEFDTVGGCVFHLLGRMPVIGDEVETDGLQLHVLSVVGHRVKRVRVSVIEREHEEAATPVEGNGNGHANGNGSAKREPAA